MNLNRISQRRARSPVTRLTLLGASLWLAGCAAPPPSASSDRTPASGIVLPATANRFTYVVVHGAWGGGWAFKEVDRLLTADGHRVYRPTLTGQGERVHLASTNRLGANIDLTMHIEDIVNVILWEDLREVVLVGHSYGGMVITGVADRVPDRLRHVVYLDAFLPEDGESLNSGAGRAGTAWNAPDGFVAPTWLRGNPPPPHDVPHPARTLSEPIFLKNQDAARKIPATYILTVDAGRAPEQDGFFRSYERARARGWKVLTMEGDHNVQWSKPGELVRLLEAAP